MMYNICETFLTFNKIKEELSKMILEVKSNPATFFWTLMFAVLVCIVSAAIYTFHNDDFRGKVQTLKRVHEIYGKYKAVLISMDYDDKIVSIRGDIGKYIRGEYKSAGKELTPEDEKRLVKMYISRCVNQYKGDIEIIDKNVDNDMKVLLSDIDF